MNPTKTTKVQARPVVEIIVASDMTHIRDERGAKQEVLPSDFHIIINNRLVPLYLVVDGYEKHQEYLLETAISSE